MSKLTTRTVEHWLDNQLWLDRQPDDEIIEAYVATLPTHYNFDMVAQLKAWRDKGYVIFKQVADPADIDALCSDIAHLKAHYTEFALMAESRGTQKPISNFSLADLDSDGVKFNNIQTISRAASKLSLTLEVMQFLQQIFQSPACVLQSLTFYRGSQQAAHIDYPYVNCQTKLPHLAASWIPLEDIHPDAGPLIYYPGSHKHEVSGFFDWGEGSITKQHDSQQDPMQFFHFLQQQLNTAGIQPEIFCPEKGDVLLWHSNLIHGGSSINNPALTRKSYVTHYTSLEAYPPDHKNKTLSPEKAGLYKNGGYCFDFPWVGQDTQRLPSWHEQTQKRRKRWFKRFL